MPLESPTRYAISSLKRTFSRMFAGT
jgi:hypothetical protein